MPPSSRIPGASLRRITLTPGIRWEYIGSPHSTVNHMGNFDPNQPGGAIQVGPGLPNLHGRSIPKRRTLTLASASLGTSLATARRCCAPESACCPASRPYCGHWAVKFRTEPRCAYGHRPPASRCTGRAISSSIDTGRRSMRSTPQHFRSTPATASRPGPQPARTRRCTVDLQQTTPIFPSTSASAPRRAHSARLALQCSMFVSDPNFKNPRSVQWNMDIQRAITNN